MAGKFVPKKYRKIFEEVRSFFEMLNIKSQLKVLALAYFSGYHQAGNKHLEPRMVKKLIKDVEVQPVQPLHSTNLYGSVF